VLGLPVVLLGFTPPDDQAHAPNESMRLDNYEGGVRTIVRYWQRLAETAL
jgi:acetylornithine deacetylase/succinyl-diaminopimelate desuccinylase-like protein